MLCGTGVYSYIIGTLSSVLGMMATREQDLNLKTIYLNQFSKDANIPKELREKMTQALEYTSKN